MFLGFGWWDHLHRDLLQQLSHSSPSKQQDIRVATGLSDRPPQGRSGRDLHRLHHTKNNTTTKVGYFCPVALSCGFMGDNFKDRAHTEHCVRKRKGKQGHPFTELVYCCVLLRALLPIPRPGPKKVIYFLNFFIFAHKHPRAHRTEYFRKSLIFVRSGPDTGSTVPPLGSRTSGKGVGWTPPS